MIGSTSTIQNQASLRQDLARVSKARKRFLEVLFLSIGLVFVVWMGIAIGASQVDILLPLNTFYDFLTGRLEETLSHNIVANIRTPRVIMAVLVGAALAVSGASLQGICRNPLADPGLLGISSGAAVGAVAMILFAKHLPSIAFAGPYLVSIAAFIGAAIATF